VFQSAGSQVLLEKQGSTTTATYTYGNGLVRKDSEYPLYDGLGSARTVTNGSQTVTGTCIYNDFGQVVASTGSTGSAYQFAATSGYRTDGDAGLMKVGARYYDAQVGRFITRDTVLSEHPYLYCEHDPVNKVDPSGHFGQAAVIFIPGVGQALLIIGVATLAVIGVISLVRWIGGMGGGGGSDDPEIPKRPLRPLDPTTDPPSEPLSESEIPSRPLQPAPEPEIPSRPVRDPVGRFKYIEWE
jgi:RHS repeat-associated protein